MFAKCLDLNGIICNRFHKMNLRTLLIVIVGTISWSTPTNAQDSDACGCNAVLVNGVYNYRAVKADASAQQLVEQYIAKTSYDEFRKNFQGSGGISVPQFCGISAETSKEEYEKKQQTYRSKDTNWSTSATSQDILERFGDSNVLNAWAACKASCKQNGLHSWIDVRDQHYITFHLKFIADHDETIRFKDSVVVGAVSMTEGVAPGTLLKPTDWRQGEKTIWLHRDDSSKPVIVHVEVSGGLDQDAYIPAWIPPASNVTPAIAESYKDIILCSGGANACREEVVGYRGNLAGVPPKGPGYPPDGPTQILPVENLPAKAKIIEVESAKTEVLYEESGKLGEVNYNRDPTSATKGYLVRVHSTQRDLVVQGFCDNNSDRRVKIRVWFKYQQ